MSFGGCFAALLFLVYDRIRWFCVLAWIGLDSGFNGCLVLLCFCEFCCLVAGCV